MAGKDPLGILGSGGRKDPLGILTPEKKNEPATPQDEPVEGVDGGDPVFDLMAGRAGAPPNGKTIDVVDTYEDTPQAKFISAVGADLNKKLKGKDVRQYAYDKNSEIYHDQAKYQVDVNSLSEIQQYPKIKLYRELVAQHNNAPTKENKEWLADQIAKLSEQPLLDKGQNANEMFGIKPSENFSPAETASESYQQQISMRDNLKAGLRENIHKEFSGLTVADAIQLMDQRVNSANKTAQKISTNSDELGQVIKVAQDLADFTGNADGVKEVGTIHSFFNGAKSTIDASIDAVKLALSDDTQRRKMIEQEMGSQILFPEQPDSWIAEKAQEIGGVAPYFLPHTALEQMGAGAIARTVGGMLTDAMLMGTGSYSTAFKNAYAEASKKQEPNEALKTASEIAKESAAVGAATGASFPIMGALGSKVGMKTLGQEGVSKLVAGKPLSAVEYLKMALPQNFIAGGLPLGVQAYANNRIMEAHDISPEQAEGASEAIANGTIFGFMLNEVIGRGYVAPKVKDVYRNTLAKFQFPEVIEAMNKGLEEGMITPQLHEEVVQDLAFRRKIFDAMPANQTPQQDAISFPYVDAIQKLDKQNQNPNLLPVHKKNNQAEMERLMMDMQEKLGTPLDISEQSEFDKLNEKKQKGLTAETPTALGLAENNRLRHFERRIETGERVKKEEETRLANERAQEELKDSPVISIGEMMDRPVLYNGEKATLMQDGNTIIAKTAGGREYEIGTAAEVASHPIKDYGIEQQESVVTSNDRGNVEVRGQEYFNNYSDPTAAINYDANGNIISVNLETTNGSKRTFRGDVAEDIAYQITLRELESRNEISELENFINEDGNTTKEINDARPVATAEGETVENTQPIQREKAARRDRSGTTVELPGGERTGENGDVNKQSDAGNTGADGVGNVEGPGRDLPREGEVGGIQDASNPEGGAGKGPLITPADIHSLADEAGIKWDGDADFMAASRELTGKEHLDEMTPAELNKVGDWILEQATKGVDAKEFDEFLNEDKEAAREIVAADLQSSIVGLRKKASVTPIEEMIQEADVVLPKSGSLTPTENTFKEGDLLIENKGDPDNPYVYGLQMIDPRGVDYSEKHQSEEGVLGMETTQKYIEWSKEGKMPQPITVVFNQPDQKFTSTNRRRLLAAREAGVKIPAWIELGRIKDLQKPAIGSKSYKKTTYPEGRTIVKTVADGTKIRGTYKIVSADDVIASHNEETFAQSEGFPVNEAGNTINDRDYSRDTNAQTEVVRIAQSLDDRAVMQTPVVTKDGIVVDGNNRTMSRKLAAKNGTDSAYLEALREQAELYGLKPEDVAAVKNPMLVFEPTEPLPYTTKTMAKFNKSEKKEKSPIERAVEVSKTISDRARRVLGDIYSDADKPSDVTSNPQTVSKIVKALQEENILQPNELPRYFDVDRMTATKEGVAFMESLLMGGALNEKTIRLLDNENMGNVKNKLLKAIVPLTKNAALGENSLTQAIEGAIELVNTAKQSGQTILDAVSQLGLHDARKYSAEELAMATYLDGEGFGKFLDKYNGDVGKDVLFEGVLTKEKIIDNALRQKFENYEKIRKNLAGNDVGGEGKVGKDNGRGNEEPAGENQAEGAGEGGGEKEVKQASPLDETLAKYGWSSEEKDGNVVLKNAKGKEVATITKDAGLYTVEDMLGNKLMVSRGAIEKAAERVATEYFYAKEVKADVKAEKIDADIQEAKDELKNAFDEWKDITDPNKMGIAKDPKKEAEAMYRIHKALVKYAKAYIAKGINDIKKFAASIGITAKQAKQAWDEATGVKVYKKEELDYNVSDLTKEAIKRGINVREKFAQYKKDQQDLKGAISAFLKDKELNAAMNPVQVKALADRAANVSTENQLNKFLTYAERVFDNANYAKMVDDIRMNQRRARAINHTGYSKAVKEFTSINPNSVPPDRLFDYQKALDEITSRVPDYTTMQSIYHEMMSYKPLKDFDDVQTMEDATGLYSRIFKNPIESVEDYRNLFADINGLKRRLKQLEQNGNITREEFEDVMEQVGKSTADVKAKFADKIDILKGDMVQEIRSKTLSGTGATKEEQVLVNRFKEQKNEDLRRLEPEELWELNELMDRANDGNFDYYRWNEILTDAEARRRGQQLGEQFKGAETIPPQQAASKLAKQEAPFIEGVLGLGRSKPGALGKFVVEELERAASDYTQGIRDGLSEFVKMKRGLDKSSMNKIGMVLTYLQEHSAQFNPKFKAVENIGKRDWFGQILSNPDHRIVYEGEKVKTGLLRSSDKATMIQKVWDSLPKDAEGNVDVEAVYKSITSKDGTILNEKEQAFLDDAMKYMDDNIRPKQQASNYARGMDFDAIDFYMPRVDLMSRRDIETRVERTGNQVRIKSAFGEERRDQSVRPIETDFEELFAKAVEAANRDYYFGNSVDMVNKTLGYAAREGGSSKQLSNTVAENVKDMMEFEFNRKQSDAATAIGGTLLKARAAQTLIDPIRTFFVELPATFIQAPLRAANVKGFADILNPAAHKTFTDLLEFSESPLRLRENISKQIDVEGGKIKPRPLRDKALTFLAGLPERLTMIGSWMPTFKSEFEQLSGSKFDEKKFNTDPDYREENSRNIKEAAASANLVTQKIIGVTTKLTQAREIPLPFMESQKGIDKDSAIGKIFGFFGNYPRREYLEFVNGFKEVGERLRNGDGISSAGSLTKPLAVAMGALTYGYMGSLVYAMKQKYLGTDDEQEKGAEALERLSSNRGIAEEASAQAIALAGSKYYSLGRAALQTGLLAGYNFTDDEETKATMKRLYKNAFYADPIDPDASKSYKAKSNKEKLALYAANYIPQLSLAINKIQGAVESYGGAEKLYTKYNEEGWEAMTKDEQDLILLTEIMLKSAGIVANVYGSTIPMEKTFEMALRGMKEDSNSSSEEPETVFPEITEPAPAETE